MSILDETKQGYVYILTNPSFKEDWVKIGKRAVVNCLCKHDIYKM